MHAGQQPAHLGSSSMQAWTCQELHTTHITVYKQQLFALEKLLDHRDCRWHAFPAVAAACQYSGLGCGQLGVLQCCCYLL